MSMLALALDGDWQACGAGHAHAALPLRVDLADADDGEPGDGPAPGPPAVRRTGAGGWRVDWTEQLGVDRAGRPELRLVARYHLYDARPALIIAGPPDVIAAHRAWLEPLALAATPAPSSAPTCLADLLAGTSEV